MADVPQYLRARADGALQRCRSLLEGLSSRPIGSDPQSVESIRTIVHSRLTEIVDEFSAHGGPRVERIDHLFTMLLGAEPVSVASEVGGLLRKIGSKLDKYSDKSIPFKTKRTSPTSAFWLITSSRFELRGNHTNQPCTGARTGHSFETGTGSRIVAEMSFSAL